MIRLLALNGQQAAALKRFEDYELLLQAELGLPASQEARALYASIQDGSLGTVSGLHSAVGKLPEKPPFKGLQHYDVGDAELFFGRVDLTAQLALQLHQQAFLAVIGASGSGKSSLVRAGLIPALRSGSRLADGSLPPHGADQWPVHLFTPTAHPLEALAASLTRQAQSVAATATLMDDLTADFRSLHLYVRKLLAQDGGNRLVLVIDQFEELFTLCRDPAERRAFIENLVTAVEEGIAGPTTVVLTLRADFDAHCAEFDGLRGLLERFQVYIGQMDTAQLRRSIEGPARWSGHEFEEGLVDLVLRDLGAREDSRAEPGALPLLSHTLLEVWNRRHEKSMTISAYIECGGVQGAIAQSAERVYRHQLTESQREIARSIFLRLTEPGEGTQDTRRRASLEELVLRREDGAAVEEVLNILAGARLISVSQGSAEVAHEALIREWPRLQEWLERGREELRLHRSLTEAAKGWLDLDRDSGALYRGLKLAQATEWARVNDGLLNPLEREFLERSQDLALHRAAEQEAQRQRELETARSLAAAEKRRAEERERAAREQADAAEQLRKGRRALIGALVLATGMALVAIVLGLQFRQRANEEAALNRLLRARQVAASSIEMLQVDPALALLLAIESANITRRADQTITLESEIALYQALGASQTMVFRTASSLRSYLSPDGRHVATSGFSSPVRIWNSDGSLRLALPFVEFDPLLAFAPDGSHLLTTVGGSGLVLWDLQGQSAGTYAGHPGGGVRDLDFNPAGNLFVSAGSDPVAKLWHVEIGLLATLEGHKLALNSARFGQGSNRVLTSSEDGTAMLWDVSGAIAGGSEPILIATLKGHADRLFSAEMNGEGTRIVTASADGTARPWDGDGNFLVTLEGHQGWVISAEFSPDGERILTASHDGTAKIWDLQGRLFTSLVGHTDSLSSAHFSPDGNRIVTSSGDGNARVWDARGNFIRLLAGHSGQINNASFSSDGRRVLTGGSDGTARLWALDSFLVAELHGHGEAIEEASFDMVGDRILTAGSDGTVRLWGANGEPEFTLDTDSGKVWSATFEPNGTRILAGLADGSARLWDANGKLIARMEGHSRAIRWVAFSPDGERLVTCSEDGTARLWSSDGVLLQTLQGHLGFVMHAAFSPDGSLLVTAGWDRQARLWSRNGDLVAVMKGHYGQIEWTDFAPDGRRILTTGWDGTARLWDNQGNSIAILEGHHDRVNSGSFSPDGAQIVTASSDGNARLWDRNGALIALLPGHQGAVLGAQFSPDGRRLVTIGEDGTARLWDSQGGLLAALPGHSGGANSADFSPDGTRLITADQDGTGRLWQVWPDVESMLAEAETRVSRTLTEGECRTYLQLTSCP